MKRKYIRPEMRCVAIMRHRIMVGSDPLAVRGASDSLYEETEVGW